MKTSKLSQILVLLFIVSTTTLTGCLETGGQNSFSSHAFDTDIPKSVIVDTQGNLGIWTLTPATILHLQSPSADYGSLMIGGNTAGNNHHLLHEADGSFKINSGVFGAATNVFAIDPTGDVGVGVEAPLGKLHVNTTTNRNLIVDTSSASFGSTAGVGIAGTNDAGSALVNLSVSAADLILQAGTGAGNVGIKTTAPTNVLDIQVPTATGAATTEGIAIHDGAVSRTQLAMGVNTAGLYSWIQSSQATVGTNNIAMQPNGGNVGVGVTNPVQNIHIGSSGVLSNLKITNSATGILVSDGSSIGQDGFGANLGLSIWNYENAPLRLGTNNLERLTILANGRVGVLNPAPGYELEVTGDFNASGCVNAGGGNLGGACVSDERLKTDVHSFDLGLNELLGINPKYFKYNGLGEHPASKVFSLGVIAQDLEKAAPSLVSTRHVTLHPEDVEKTVIKQVNYSALIYVVINSIKEFYAKWVVDSQSLHSEIASLKAQNLELIKRLEKLEAKK